MVIGIDYDEVDPTSYKAVTCADKRFDTGKFHIDWYNCMKFITTLTEFEPIVMSSSFDSFLSSDLQFDEVWLIVENNSFKFVDNDSQGGLPFFIPKSSNMTWEELKSLTKQQR